MNISDDELKALKDAVLQAEQCGHLTVELSADRVLRLLNEVTVSRAKTIAIRDTLKKAGAIVEKASADPIKMTRRKRPVDPALGQDHKAEILLLHPKGTTK